MDATHVVFLSFSSVFFLFSVVNTILSFFNLTYPLNSPILLFVALYAILFSLFNSSYFNSNIKLVGLFIIPFFITPLVLLAIYYDVDLTGLNNGLSLVALAVSILFLTFRTFEEAVEREMNDRNIEEIEYLKNQINRQEVSHKEVKDLLMGEWKIAVEEIRKVNADNIRLERELDDSKGDITAIATQHQYEKTDMVEEFELHMYQNQQEIEKLEREIEELKKQKEDA